MFEISVKSAVALLLLFDLTVPAVAQAADCVPSFSGKYSGLRTFDVDGAKIFKTPELAVDADGAPNSYLVNGNGLSYTCDGAVALVNGVRHNATYDRKHGIKDDNPKNWQALCRAAWKKANETKNFSGMAIFGFEVGADGLPAVQSSGDPLPGTAFITTTSVSIPGQPEGTQRKYVDATAIPYIVLPTSFVSDLSVGEADLAVVYWPDKGKFAYAVYGDGGSLGEGSVRLHFDLGSNPISRRGGVDRAKNGIGSEVVTLVFPGKKTHPVLDAEKWRAEITKSGADVFQQWGGLEKLKACSRN